MLVNGFLPTSHLPDQEGVNSSHSGATVDAGGVQGGDFPALLFLILGTPKMPETAATGDAEATSIGGSGEAEADANRLVNQAGDVFGANRPAAVISAKTADPESAGEVPFENSGTQLPAMEIPFAVGACMRAGSDPALQETTPRDAGQANVAMPVAAQTGEAQRESSVLFLDTDSRLLYNASIPHEMSRGVAVSQSGKPADENGKIIDAGTLPEPGNPITGPTFIAAGSIDNGTVEADAFDENAIGKTSPITAAAPEESSSVGADFVVKTGGIGLASERLSLHGARARQLPADDAGAAPIKAGISDGAKATQVKSDEFEFRESYARFQELAAYDRNGVRAEISKIAREHASVMDGRPPLGSQSEPQASGAAHGGSLWETIHLGDEAMSTNLHGGEQGSFFQENQREPTHDSVRAAFEPLWRDTAPIQSVPVTDSVPQAPGRSIHWRPVIEHVASEITGHIRIGKSEAVVQLDPPELGKLHIELRLDGDKVEAHIVVEKQDSSKLIEAHLPELRQAFAENRVEHVEVRIDTGVWNGARGDSQQGQRQQAGDGSQRSHDSRGAGRNNAEESEAARYQLAGRGAGRVSMWA
jgi:hypothetical protein